MQKESRTKIFREYVRQMREKRERLENEHKEGNKRVCAGDKPWTKMKEKEGNEK